MVWDLLFGTLWEIEIWWALGEWGWRPQDRFWKTQGVISPLIPTTMMTVSLLKRLQIQHGLRTKLGWKTDRLAMAMRSSNMQVSESCFSTAWSLKHCVKQATEVLRAVRAGWVIWMDWGYKCVKGWYGGPSVQVTRPHSLSPLQVPWTTATEADTLLPCWAIHKPAACDLPMETKRRSKKKPQYNPVFTQ